jgi:hypothetical protein
MLPQRHWTARLREWFREQQQQRCAICGNHFFLVSPALDHSHETGQCRGVLCRDCNNALGLFRENIQNMEAAITYLQANYEDNPPHPTFRPPAGLEQATKGLTPRDFNYQNWFDRQKSASKPPTEPNSPPLPED